MIHTDQDTDDTMRGPKVHGRRDPATVYADCAELQSFGHVLPADDHDHGSCLCQIPRANVNGYC